MFKQKIIAVTALALGMLTQANLAHAQVIADSVQDFSGTQGQSGWYYGFYQGTFAPSNFQPMVNFNTSSLPDAWSANFDYGATGNVWTLLSNVGGHPNGITTSGGRQSLDQWAVRRWVSNVAEAVTITGNISDLNGQVGNGVIGHIFVNGNDIFQAVINNGDSVGNNYSLTAHLNIGDKIDFAIDPRDSNDLGDGTKFTATISAVPEPETYAMMLAGLGLMGAIARRRKAKQTA